MTSANKTVVFADPPAEPINQHWFSAYVRDRWTISRKLTASLGLRWDYYGFPNARTRGIGVYDIASNRCRSAASGQVPENCGVSMPRTVLAAPRAGIPVVQIIRHPRRVRHQPDTVFAGTFGAEPLSHDDQSYVPFSEFLQLVRHSRQGLPTITLPTVNNGFLVAPNNVNMSVLPKDFPWPYSQSWNVTVQKELRYGFTAQAGYVASRTVRAMTQDSGATDQSERGTVHRRRPERAAVFPDAGPHVERQPVHSPRNHLLQLHAIQSEPPFSRGLANRGLMDVGQSGESGLPDQRPSLPVSGFAAGAELGPHPRGDGERRLGAAVRQGQEVASQGSRSAARYSAAGPSTAWPCSTADCRSP